ncbi:Predicted dehydrogenase [Paenibacillus uliginis N3/975]|uniref:Predicted dehydrogenase n=1 Tax=Paenibacillus uliginis N3/975 TaxID=1313296 RepID=A0A1X7H6Z0_9BACL|nr:Gfo/Idh/MocA family oxidoreductase [Paenibacillus uliginis]SMF80733.1 Predicted dehydrogenase [Paenibacillus uliginis N3/975]
MQKIRVGIIGGGFGASVHAPIFQMHEGFEVECIASVHRGLSEKDMPNIKQYTDWNKMLEAEELDLVSVVSAPVHHCSMTMEALKNGLHVLCEKPLGMNSDQTRLMMNEIIGTKCKGFVNFQWRLTPVRQRIKQILKNRELGSIHHMKYQGIFSGYEALATQPRGWEGQKESGGGHLFAVGSHMLDSMMWWMEEEIDHVYASMRTVVPSFSGATEIENRNTDDAFSIIGSFSNGTSFTSDVFYPGIRGTGWTLEIYGSKGTLIMRNDQSIELSFGGDFKELKINQMEPPYELKAPLKHYYSVFYPMVDLIHKSINGDDGLVDLPTFDDGHKVQSVLDAIIASANTQSRIQVSYSR